MNIIKKIIFSVFVIANILLNAQELEGKWIHMKGINVMSKPTIPVIEFKEGKMISYDFNRPIDSTSIVVSNNFITYPSGVKANFEFLSDNVILLNTNPDKSLMMKYFKIEETDTDLNEDDIKMKISCLELYVDENKELKIKQSSNSDSKTLEDITYKGFSIEKINETYFLAIYIDELLQYVFPIEEINRTSMTIFNSSLNKMIVQNCE
ncbi:hypothetical protein [Winogradskyella algicola]|uniref:hypothetical protein n=1 Tax=Winogradskyella algicola TaxID=2575815 RepID=UPI0011098F2A|nr:hypothetical protein [Winogradskyella algicola]